MSQSLDLATHQLLALTRSSLAALRAALIRDAGPAAASYLQEAGYAGGESLFASFRSEYNVTLEYVVSTVKDKTYRCITGFSISKT